PPPRQRRSPGAGRGATDDGRRRQAGRRPLAPARRQHPGAARPRRRRACRATARLMTDLGPSVRRVQEALAAAGGGHSVIALDEDLLRWPDIWASAGHPNTVFKLTPDDLVRLTGGRVAAVKSS